MYNKIQWKNSKKLKITKVKNMTLSPARIVEVEHEIYQVLSDLRKNKSYLMIQFRQCILNILNQK